MSAQPDAGMMAAVDRLVRFMAAGAAGEPGGVFADSDVTIIENFAPYIFSGASAVRDWTAGFRAHAASLAELNATFGEAQDFSVDGGRVYFSLPTTWTGTSGGKRFSEDGGWAFVLARESADWRVQAYGWAVTDYRPT